MTPPPSPPPPPPHAAAAVPSSSPSLLGHNNHCVPLFTPAPNSVAPATNMITVKSAARPHHLLEVSNPKNQKYNALAPANHNKQNSQSKSERPICLCTAGRCSIVTKHGLSYYVCPIKEGHGACDHFVLINNHIPPDPAPTEDNNSGKGFSVVNESGEPNLDQVVDNNQVRETELACGGPPVLEDGEWPFEIDDNGNVIILDDIKPVQNLSKTELASGGPPLLEDGEWPFEIDDNGNVIILDDIKPVQNLSNVQIAPEAAATPAPCSPKRQHMPGAIARTPAKIATLHERPGPATSGPCYRCGEEGHWWRDCTAATSCWRKSGK